MKRSATILAMAAGAGAGAACAVAVRRRQAPRVAVTLADGRVVELPSSSAAALELRAAAAGVRRGFEGAS